MIIVIRSNATSDGIRFVITQNKSKCVANCKLRKCNLLNCIAFEWKRIIDSGSFVGPGNLKKWIFKAINLRKAIKPRRALFYCNKRGCRSVSVWVFFKLWCTITCLSQESVELKVQPNVVVAYLAFLCCWVNSTQRPSICAHFCGWRQISKEIHEPTTRVFFSCKKVFSTFCCNPKIIHHRASCREIVLYI